MTFDWPVHNVDRICILIQVRVRVVGQYVYMDELKYEYYLFLKKLSVDLQLWH